MDSMEDKLGRIAPEYSTYLHRCKNRIGVFARSYFDWKGQNQNDVDFKDYTRLLSYYLIPHYDDITVARKMKGLEELEHIWGCIPQRLQVNEGGKQIETLLRRLEEISKNLTCYRDDLISKTFPVLFIGEKGCIKTTVYNLIKDNQDIFQNKSKFVIIPVDCPIESGSGELVRSLPYAAAFVYVVDTQHTKEVFQLLLERQKSKDRIELKPFSPKCTLFVLNDTDPSHRTKARMVNEFGKIWPNKNKVQIVEINALRAEEGQNREEYKEFTNVLKKILERNILPCKLQKHRRWLIDVLKFRKVSFKKFRSFISKQQAEVKKRHFEVSQKIERDFLGFTNPPVNAMYDGARMDLKSFIKFTFDAKFHQDLKMEVKQRTRSKQSDHEQSQAACSVLNEKFNFKLQKWQNESQIPMMKERLKSVLGKFDHHIENTIDKETIFDPLEFNISLPIERENLFERFVNFFKTKPDVTTRVIEEAMRQFQQDVDGKFFMSKYRKCIEGVLHGLESEREMELRKLNAAEKGIIELIDKEKKSQRRKSKL